MKIFLSAAAELAFAATAAAAEAFRSPHERSDMRDRTRMSRSLSSGAHSRDPVAHSGYGVSAMHRIQPKNTRPTPGTPLSSQNRVERAPSLDFWGFGAMFRATFGKPEPPNAQYYYQTPYRRRTQAHRRGWLRPSKIGRCAGVLSGPFLFSKKTDRDNPTEESR